MGKAAGTGMESAGLSVLGSKVVDTEAIGDNSD